MLCRHICSLLGVQHPAPAHWQNGKKKKKTIRKIAKQNEIIINNYSHAECGAQIALRSQWPRAATVEQKAKVYSIHFRLVEIMARVCAKLKIMRTVMMIDRFSKRKINQRNA